MKPTDMAAHGSTPARQRPPPVDARGHRRDGGGRRRRGRARHRGRRRACVGARGDHPEAGDHRRRRRRRDRGADRSRRKPAGPAAGDDHAVLRAVDAQRSVMGAGARRRRRAVRHRAGRHRLPDAGASQRAAAPAPRAPAHRRRRRDAHRRLARRTGDQPLPGARVLARRDCAGNCANDVFGFSLPSGNPGALRFLVMLSLLVLAVGTAGLALNRGRRPSPLPIQRALPSDAVRRRRRRAPRGVPRVPHRRTRRRRRARHGLRRDRPAHRSGRAARAGAGAAVPGPGAGVAGGPAVGVPGT